MFNGYFKSYLGISSRDRISNYIVGVELAWLRYGRQLLECFVSGSLLTARQAAVELFGEDATRSDLNRVYRWIADGTLTAIRRGRNLYIPRSELLSI